MRLVDLFEATNLDRKIASTFQNKISTKLTNDPSAPDVEPLDFVEWLRTEVAPIPNRAYTEWLVSKYVNGGINHYEDFSAIKQQLLMFEQTKKKLPVRDVNQIQSASDLFKLVNDNKLNAISDNDLKDYAEKTTKIIYDGPEGKIIWPRTRGASCYYGKDSNWCVSASTSRNYFGEYYKQGVDIYFGGLYT